MAARLSQLAREIRRLLDRVAQATADRGVAITKDELEEILDEITGEARALPRHGLVEALDQAIGRSAGRRQASIYLLGDWTDVPGIGERIRELTSSPDRDTRWLMVQAISSGRLINLAPELRRLVSSEPDSMVRGGAIHAAIWIGATDCYPAIVELARSPNPVLKSDLSWRLVWALDRIGTADCLEILERDWRDPFGNWEHRSMAAGALARRGNAEAHAWLTWAAENEIPRAAAELSTCKPEGADQ